MRDDASLLSLIVSNSDSDLPSTQPACALFLVKHAWIRSIAAGAFASQELSAGACWMLSGSGAGSERSSQGLSRQQVHKSKHGMCSVLQRGSHSTSGAGLPGVLVLNKVACR